MKEEGGVGFSPLMRYPEIASSSFIHILHLGLLLRIYIHITRAARWIDGFFADKVFLAFLRLPTFDNRLVINLLSR